MARARSGTFCVATARTLPAAPVERLMRRLGIKGVIRGRRALTTTPDAYDNALAECVIGLFKTEVINQTVPWKSMREVGWETLKWPYGDASIAYRPTGRLA